MTKADVPINIADPRAIQRSLPGAGSVTSNAIARSVKTRGDLSKEEFQRSFPKVDSKKVDFDGLRN